MERQQKREWERVKKILRISTETLFQILNLPRWTTLQKVKIFLDGFNPVRFCVFNGKINSP